MFKKSITFLLLCNALSFTVCSSLSNPSDTLLDEQGSNHLSAIGTGTHAQRPATLSNKVTPDKANLVVEQPVDIGLEDEKSGYCYARIESYRYWNSISLFCSGVSVGIFITLAKTGEVTLFYLGGVAIASLASVVNCIGLHCNRSSTNEIVELTAAIQDKENCCGCVSIQHKGYWYCCFESPKLKIQ